MKKLLATAIVAATPMMAQADLLFTIDAGASIWQADASGSVESSIGDVVDLGSDGMNLKESDQNVLFASFEHPIPILPNVKIMSTALDFSGDDQSKLDLSNTDLTLYWGVPLPIPFLDINFGLTARQFDGEIVNVSASTPISEELDFVVPMGYLNLELDTPFGIYGYVDLNTISYSGNGITDTAIAIGYTLPIPLVDINLEAGHRSLAVKTDEDLAGIDTDIDVSGMFYGVNLSVGF
ncbi:hypothetical protein A9R00_02390 [Oleispira antarctica]|uniref:Outer membrane protein n=1 Tax=Oleispira antarctica TaxID=188908 RepID=A0A1Y5I1R8_OLEAN|nr:hypothetical protein A9R00_02390 [Oleispira antarctica]